MTTKEIEDYLTKRVYIDHDVVTFRFLSRHFSIHVERARNELATYHRNSAFRGQPCTATYMLIGEAYPERKAKQQAPFSSHGSEAYDVMMMYGPTPDENGNEGKEYDEDGYDDGEEVTAFLSMLVNEDDLETAKSRYYTITTEYVYSVAPSRLIDGGLICHLTEEVRDIDNKNGQEWADKVGRLTCPGVTLCPIEAPKILPYRRTSADGPGRTNFAVAGPSKPAATTEKDAKKAEPPKGTTGKKISVDNKPAPTTKAQEGTDNKQKKMNFFQPKKTNSAKSTEDSKGKGRVKDEVEKSADEEGDTPKVKPQAKVAAASKSKPEVPTRGTKRKTPATAYSDDDSEPPHTTPPRSSPDDPVVRVQKGVILSSDEDDTPKPKTTMSRNAKLAARAEEQERQALKTMLELDDDKVIKQSRRTASSKARYIASEDYEDELEQSSIAKDSPQEEFEPMDLAHLEDEDIEMEDDVESKPKSKRKPRKVIPVGKNGLKKKRVMKSRTKVDDKGYLVTEDYSCYESVDEEQESEPAKPKKSKAKATGTRDPEGKKLITVSSGSITKRKGRQSGGQSETEDESTVPPPKPALKPKPLAKSSTSKGNGNGGATKGSISKVVKGQKSINTFFTPSRK